ncbi:MAG: hypothetical protein ABEJ60_05425 [Halodesulfurarchaeum sp.]
MSSSARRAQVEPLPALIALAVFAIGLSLYGVTLDGLPLGSEPEITDSTMTATMNALTEGPVVIPARVESPRVSIPRGIAVTVRADGRVWVRGTPPADPERTRMRRVLVRTASGEVIGILRVSA